MERRISLSASLRLSLNSVYLSSIYLVNMSPSVPVHSRTTPISAKTGSQSAHWLTRAGRRAIQRILYVEYPNEMEDASCNTHVQGERYSPTYLPTDLPTYLRPTNLRVKWNWPRSEVRRVCLLDVERDCSVDLGRQRYI